MCFKIFCCHNDSYLLFTLSKGNFQHDQEKYCRQLIAYHEVLDPGKTQIKTKLLMELRKILMIQVLIWQIVLERTVLSNQMI